MYPQPHYPANSRAVVGTFPWIYRKLRPRRPRPTPSWTLEITKYKIELLARYTSDQGARVVGQGVRDLPSDYKKRSPLQSWTLPWAVPWMSQGTKLSPWASSHYPQAAGPGILLGGMIFKVGANFGNQNRHNARGVWAPSEVGGFWKCNLKWSDLVHYFHHVKHLTECLSTRVCYFRTG